MEFYTLTTTVDIVTDQEALAAVHSAIGFFCQPEIIGQPHNEDGSFIFRFAVRDFGISEPDTLILLLSQHKKGFDADNTQLVRAERI